MATVKIETVIEERTITTEVEVTRYILDLSEKEAESLMHVCDSVAGVRYGRRGHMDGISRALRGAGVDVIDIDSSNGSITFVGDK